MFDRRHRLPTARAVKRLYAKGRRLARPTTFLYGLANRAHSARFSVVCGKTVSPQAVARNRLKRVARATVQAHLPQIAAGYDYLVVLRPAAAGAEPRLRAELVELLDQAGRQRFA